MARETLRIGGACGFWGEAADAALPQLMGADLDAVVFDYLAEITMSILARARQKDPAKGYATDFVTDLAPHLPEIARQRLRIVSNAGGANVVACAEALRAEIARAGLPLTVATVTGDDLTPRAADFAQAREMFSGAPFPPEGEVASVNAYLGAFPIAEALRHADIVVTGRCADSAVTLGLCLHRFGWGAEDLDRLAQGSLAGHILECGPQATGGNFTDWERAGDIADIGYPIAEIAADGAFEVTKPENTAGLVTPETVGEQMLYEIGDPRAYLLPDVTADFSEVTLEQAGENRVRVAGARGRPPTDTLKTSATWADGFRAGTVLFLYGQDASRKARSYADAVLTRARRRLAAANAPDFTETLVEVMGDESHWGAHAQVSGAREVALKIAVKHPDARACAAMLKDSIGLGLATPPGLAIFAASRPRPSPVVRLFSFLVSKAEVEVAVETPPGERIVVPFATPAVGTEPAAARPAPSATPDASAAPHAPDRTPPPDVPAPKADGPLATVPLIRLAVARSGDKGDKANIGVLPRDPAFAPWIRRALTPEAVADRFAHFLAGPEPRVERFDLPGTGALNFLLHDVLGGGGVASLRNDPQGKGYAQILLDHPVAIPERLLERAR